MKLLVVRHAKSSWAEGTLSDIDRPLNKRGNRDAPFMGERLKKRGFMPDLIVSSPANRAWKTAKHIAQALGYDSGKINRDESIYLAAPEMLLNIIRDLDESKENVMIVGHNPGFTGLVNILGDVQIDNMPTCGMACFGFSGQLWSQIKEHDGTLLFFDYPKKFGLM